jgi:hypothetical protein
MNFNTVGQSVGNHTIKAISEDDDGAQTQDTVVVSLVVPPETITVTDPNGGESWEMGSSHPITWTDNIADNVKIELYKGTSMVNTIASTTASDGSYTWSIPTTLTAGADYKVRITSTTSTLTDYSNANFTLTEEPPTPYITVTDPNGGESWEMGSSHPITWTDNISDNVKIELYKGTSMVNTIASTTASDGSYTWSIPTTLTAGADYKVRITSTTSTLTDYSNANFTLTEEPPTPYITVTDPNGGESWEMGSSHPITWTDNISDNVKIELYKGTSMVNTIASTTASDGSYTWSIPTTLTAGADYKVRITSTTSTLTDYSNANFTLTEEPPTPYITVTSPNGGENWEMGNTYTISWEDNVGDITLWYDDGLKSKHLIDTIKGSKDGTYEWTIPTDLTESTLYKMKVESVDDTSIYDWSDDYFTITAATPTPFITVTDPNGGESWEMGSSHPITWTDNIADNVKIELYKGTSMVNTIASTTASDGSYTWSIPTTLTAGSDYKVRITSTTSTLTDYSNANFTLTEEPPTPYITVTSPNGGETWLTGISESITWNDNISENVKIELYKGGSYYSTVTSSTPSDGTYSWTIPALSGTDYEIRITSINNSSIWDDSNSNFTIRELPEITVTSPNGGETWQNGVSTTITWTDNLWGDENVKITLYKGTVLSGTIVSSTPSDGSFSFVPLTLPTGNDFKVCITTVDEIAGFKEWDYSNAYFSIIPLKH